MARVTSFIDFDSTYRNRNTDPNPGYFTVPIATTTSTNVINDPVCAAMPLLSWTGARFTVGAIGPQFSNTMWGEKSCSITIYIQEIGAQLQRQLNYYAGAVCQFADSEQRRITSYTYTGSGLGKIQLDNPVASFAAGLAVTIFDQTNFTNPASLEIFVPCGAAVDNLYTGMLMYNENHDEYRIITRYSGRTRIAELDMATNPAPGWALYDNYSIRVQLPALVSAINGSTTQQVILASGSSISSTTMTNSFLREQQALYGNEANSNLLLARRIVAWDPTTQTATVTPAFNQPPVGTCEILPITYDNLNSFVNIHPKDSKTAMCDIELVTLHIPRVPVSSGFGGDITNYPYIYILLANISASTTKYMFVSNNPSATSVQFRATLSPNDNSPYFHKLTGDGTVQTLQIKPTDSLVFAVYLSNGAVWTPLYPDTTSPCAPNPLTQIAAFFSFKSASDISLNLVNTSLTGNDYKPLELSSRV